MELKLYNDIVFKWIFGRQNRTGPLIHFLNSVVGQDGGRPRFTKVLILNPFDQSEPFKNEKQGILDIRAMDKNSNEWIDLEVQVLRQDHYPQRSKYYLAGMYRDQLEKNKESNYYDLTPCYGVHVLVESLFKEESRWFHHYAMLNTKTHQPLMDHWHLYFLELNKFLKGFQKSPSPTELEQWSCFLCTPCDNEKRLDPFFEKNEAIEEVFTMLQSFTKDDQLREQYRLREEWLRIQKTEEARKQKLISQYKMERQAKEKALKAMEEERRAKEQERQAKEQERQAKEQERQAKRTALIKMEQERQAKEALLERSIFSLRETGLTNEKIAEVLAIPLSKIQGV